ncbi:dihydrofolate reductase [Pullulanibacillus sp. KACC 23026]|uniref:dihydrofolate reductase n=1 Tax=Pullulanibacillus sp. KACC 23026 TaxID=3028315 RepID=UPI0023B169A4|nr:dihydrofolate reductase [Pullulanibacillus sp. KACC 23026]WEG14555.1 dihydrofolate reductase [Pullulanibacillus sp. KACC 23026]
MKVSLIVAMDENQVIGKANKLPWHLPRDWDYVKEMTSGHAIVMGRRCFESIGRPLKNRRNIVLTRELGLSFFGCEMAHSIDEVFKLCENEEEMFIFGGEEIYRLFLPYVHKMYVTRIYEAFEGDTYFPEVDWSEWREVSVTEGLTDQANPYRYDFHIYKRIETTS